MVVRNNRRVFSEVVEQYLRRIDFASDGYAQLIRLPQCQVADVTVDEQVADVDWSDSTAPTAEN